MKIVKQAGTLMLASSLLLTAAPAVWANEVSVDAKTISIPAYPGGGEGQVLDAKITKEQALERAKSYIALPEGYTMQSISLNAYWGMGGRNFPTWNISYVKKVKEKNYGYMNVSINGLDGSLTAYSMNDNDPDRKPSYPPKVDFQGAKAVASAFIAKVNPDKQHELVYNDSEEKAFRTPLNGNYQYNIRFDRSVDGVLFAMNGVSVSVNGDGEVTNYNYNWMDNVTFPTGVKPIAQEKAAQLFHDKAAMSLLYQIPYGAKGKKLPILSYIMGGFSLNAETGEPWNPGPQLAVGKPLTDKPLAELPAATLNLTKEEAAKKVAAAFNLPADYKLQEASYNESTNPETGQTDSYWNLNWTVTSEKDPSGKLGSRGAWAGVNSTTGAITSFNSYMPYGPEGDKEIVGKISLDDAVAKSVEFVKKQIPAYTDQLVLSVQAEKDIPAEQLKHMRNWNISFNRVIDGVIAGQEAVSVSIDRVTGEMVSYQFGLSNMPYPKQKPEVLALDKAKDLWLSQFDIKLNYVLEDGGYNGPIPLEKYNVMVAAGEMPPTAAAANKDEKLQAKLVYTLNPKFNREPFLLDAQTGVWRNSQTGETVSLDKVTVSDIDNHWAKNELQLMLDYQALDVQDGKVTPDQLIKRGELVKMLVIAMNGGNGGIYYGAERKASFADVSNASPYFAYVENAVDRGLLEAGTEFNPEATLDREEMAQLIVKALGYKSLSQYDGVFNSQFADAAELKDVGVAAIVLGLNIMTLTDGKFAPQQEVSKAQAASAFYRFLQKRAELQEPPRYYY
ncbi:S-layer homology domain-containing protein [Paenibacillus sp. GCM10023248]|uniref:S-layer homology domain-containing protein n=1 Tax=unclassified Paenibacillus TaxID=185978 RepID=UPI002379F80D|nr:S-layer homology domain-containing protein [Paenibacillus sp. MAHUQ-63]MDD9270627.1 S-layer homology domain-containing protein [Paenibacillus sp. MAHUQ-63]